MAGNAPLGGWNDDRAELATVPIDSVGLYADQPNILEFQILTLQLLARAAQRQTPQATTGGPSYFVLADSELFARVRALRGVVSVPLLRSDNSIEYFGRLWFVPRNIGHGWALDMAGRSPQDVFAEIEALGGNTRPVVVAHPDCPTEVTAYPHGVSSPEHCEIFDLNTTSVTITAIDNALDGLYNLIRTPDQSHERPLWIKRDKWWPVKLAEKAVQHEVTRALGAAFWWLDVRSEQPSSVGRTDVELIQFRSLPVGQNVRHALIELKVLRSFTSTGRDITQSVTQRQISQGIRQAAVYGLHANAGIRLLCCYDMRQTDVGTAEVYKDFQQPATDRQVVLRRYFLYNSSDALRLAEDAAMIASGATALPG